MYKESKKRVDDIYESVIRDIPKENPLMTPKVYEESRLKDIRKAAVIVIISDMYEGVS
jgi:hypothetical protein